MAGISVAGAAAASPTRAKKAIVFTIVMVVGVPESDAEGLEGEFAEVIGFQHCAPSHQPDVGNA
jgi:hypothetical protein